MLTGPPPKFHGTRDILADQPVRKVPSRDGYPRRSSRIVQRRWEMKDLAAQCMASPSGSPPYSIPSYLTLKI
jgi:hypothetical protein